jgi:AAA domain-containing protein
VSNTPVNPFLGMHLPVRSPERLFGRDELVNSLAERMQSDSPPQCVSLYGPRRIGKTSIVLCAEALARSAAGPSVVVYEDTSVWQNSSPEDVLRKLCRLIQRKLGVNKSGVDPSDALQDTLEETTQKGIRVTLILDEIGRAATNPRLDEGFFSYLRSLASLWDVQYMTCSPEPLMDYWQGLPTADSTFFGLFVTRFVGPIPSDSAISMLRSVTPSASYSAEVADRLHNLPLLLAHAGSLICAERSQHGDAISDLLGIDSLIGGVLSRPECQAFLRQLSEWSDTTGTKYGVPPLGAGLLRNDVGALPPQLKSFWHRLEPSTQKVIREAEANFRGYKAGVESVQPETVCFLYGKAVEVQLRHTVMQYLSGFIEDSVDSLGKYGMALRSLRKEPPSQVQAYLQERQITIKRLADFGRAVIVVSNNYRNPGTHDVSVLGSRDVDNVRLRVLGDGERSGLLGDAVSIHWGAQACAPALA